MYVYVCVCECKCTNHKYVGGLSECGCLLPVMWVGKCEYVNDLVDVSWVFMCECVVNYYYTLTLCLITCRTRSFSSSVNWWYTCGATVPERRRGTSLIRELRLVGGSSGREEQEAPKRRPILSEREAFRQTLFLLRIFGKLDMAMDDGEAKKTSNKAAEKITNEVAEKFKQQRAQNLYPEGVYHLAITRQWMNFISLGHVYQNKPLGRWVPSCPT